MGLYHQQLFKKWRGSPINVEFSISARSGFFETHHQGQPLLPCEVSVAPEGTQDTYHVLLGFVFRQGI